MTTDAAFPKLDHAMAAMDSFPIIGELSTTPETAAVDFDALVRARTLFPKIWRDDLAPTELRPTAQGGIVAVWSCPGWALELTVDPFSLYDIRLDSPAGMRDWTRATMDSLVADVTAVLAAMAGSGKA